MIRTLSDTCSHLINLQQITCYRSYFRILSAMMIIASSFMFAQVYKRIKFHDRDINNSANNDKYTIEQTISDEAQRNTISFDGLSIPYR